MSPTRQPNSGKDFSVIRRAAVIVPPLQDFYFTRHRFSSLGAAIVAGLLERSGIEADFFDFPLMHAGGSVIELPPDMAYLKPFLIEKETGKLSFFTRFRHFGPIVDKCVAAVLAAKPAICLFSVFAFCYADTALALARELKKRVPSIPLVAGGPGPSVYPGYFLKKNGFDYVIAGEAEVSLLPFIRIFDALSENQPVNGQSKPIPIACFKDIPNLFWHENGKVRSSGLTAKTSESTMEFAMVKTAESARSVTFSTMLSRGCPKKCTFCSSRLTSGGTFRNIPPEKLDAAVCRFIGTAGQGKGEKRVVINFEDDNFLADMSYFGKAVAVLKDRFPGAVFIAENGIDYSFLTPATCQWLLSLGMLKFNLSLASLDPGTLSLSKRFINRERYEKCIDYLHHKDIPTVTYFICGFKNDTLETASFNLSYLAHQHTLTGISLFYAVPGLPGFTDTALFDGKSSSRCCGSAAFPWNDSLSTETMITAFRLSRFINLAKSELLSEKEKRLVEIISNKQELYTMVKDKKGDEKIVVVENQDRELVKKYFKNSGL